MNFEEGKFESELHEVVSSWIVCKDSIPKRWKGEFQPITPMPYNDLQVLGIVGCSHLVSRARKTTQLLTSLSNTLRDLSTAIQAESEAAQENFDAVSNMCGLFLLPNELLVRIFQLIVNGDSDLVNAVRSKAAIKLSHVSQYFRSTALSCASLWSNITGSSRLDLLCLPRSKDALLDVAMEVDFAGTNPESCKLVFNQSLVDCLPHSGRWRSLEIQLMQKLHSSKIPKGNQEIRQTFRELDVHSLESLHFRHHRLSPYLFKGFQEFQNWDAPNLRHLTSIHYFPLSLPALANLTTLDMTFFPGHINLGDLWKGLSRMKVLEDFALKFESGGGNAGNDPFSDELELPSVRRVKIEMDSQPVKSVTLRTFFSSMSFCGAVNFHLKLGGKILFTFDEDAGANLDLSAELGVILQHDMQFPCVERFCLEANSLDIGDISAESFLESDSQWGEIILGVRLGLLPSLKHFTLRSNGCVIANIMELSVSGQPLHCPALETITIQIVKPAVRGVAFRIESMLEKQKKRGGWGIFRELVVMDNGGDNRASKPMKAYAGDDALEWCKRRGYRSMADNEFID
ncbi:hypothetical protein SCHPADRAFT_993794 [Schizopora paradoxa]|uniref:Uncharacterized protein n=1 Tax=Schizopora paradoxa TaxID=27342 RepID=A0A0H2S928_9AGAM|nr:hypothetical protein SCHPADRAFT_993794 [Schizopora paradoxa]